MQPTWEATITGKAVRYLADAPMAMKVRLPGPGVPVMTATNRAKAEKVDKSTKYAIDTIGINFESNGMIAKLYLSMITLFP
jgi:hypothetical protein